MHASRREQLLAQALRQLGSAGRFQGQGCDLSGHDPLHEPVPAEIRDGGHENEYFGHHDKGDGQQQKLCGQPNGESSAGQPLGYRACLPALGTFAPCSREITLLLLSLR